MSQYLVTQTSTFEWAPNLYHPSNSSKSLTLSKPLVCKPLIESWHMNFYLFIVVYNAFSQIISPCSFNGMHLQQWPNTWWGWKRERNWSFLFSSHNWRFLVSWQWLSNGLSKFLFLFLKTKLLLCSKSSFLFWIIRERDLIFSLLSWATIVIWLNFYARMKWEKLILCVKVFCPILVVLVNGKQHEIVI